LPLKLIALMPVFSVSLIVKTTSERPFGSVLIRPLTVVRP
jgi:hypothetical protein